ncbi:MAG: hypothetical protein UU74_C0033G0011 [Candidatus Woesebacteria bacterium GW2011_GWA1_41_7]|uniref:ParB/Sulfiredoxin domain-containing protein n=1 Tax=Candidatus Woesebacteria bacterium GW2011_GWA1_41_7 TaxID=1618556 RepID=A0A0G0WVJ6_9BACT|nr:MAG: hypothetical protein UU74_C0033G0011 [Candidatus Woesebacteria bacterium GW2011_GWA1_41_7]
MNIEPFAPFETQVCNIGKHQWSVARLVTLSRNLPVFDAPLNCLNIYTKYEITLRELVAHIQAVNKADLRYPIILDEDGEIMDGRHRIMKAILKGQDTIKAVRFDKNPDPCRINE